MFEFTKATKTKSKARIALIGPSGSGKTYTALKIANGLGGKVAVIDTEHGSASKYAGNFEFSTLELDQFSPELYIQAIQAAEKAGFDVLIIDSLSHEWNGKGGALEMVDNVTKRIKSHNSFMAWGEVTPLHNQLIDTIIGCNCHVIATMRSKTEYVIETVNGKNVPRKIGMAAIQRDGMEYEYDIVGELDHDHNLIVTKTRFVEIDGQVISKPDEALGETIKAWLTDGDEPPAKLPASPIIKKAEIKNGGSEQPPTNGDAMTQFWAYQRKEGIDRQVALDILKDAQGDFGEGQELLKQYNAEFNRDSDEGNPPIDAEDARQMASR